MQKSFIERIFPHSPGSTNALPQYEDDCSTPPPLSTPTPPRIMLRDSITTASSSPDRKRNASFSPARSQRSVASPLVRHDDPFLHVERMSKTLERAFQMLLDAQSEGLNSGGLGMGEADDVSSVGSLTPTPSIATTPLSAGRATTPMTMPIRQPKVKKITLRGARRGLEKSMLDFAALKQQELSLIEREVATRDNALGQASGLGKRRELLEHEIHKIKSEEGPKGLRTEVQAVEAEIQRLEAALFELRSKQRILRNQLSEVESARDSEMSSFTESLALTDSQTKSFLRRPPVQQSLNAIEEPGMYALKPERRTLQMAQEQWTSEKGTLAQRRASVEKEKDALAEGSKLWHEVVQKIKDFEKELKSQTRELAAQSQSQLGQSEPNGEVNEAMTSEDMSMHGVLDKLSGLISSLRKDLQEAEAKDWKLLICAIGAELVAFEQARDLLRETAGISSTDSDPGGEPEDLHQNDTRLVEDDIHDTQPSPDLLTGQLEDMLLHNGTKSPGESSNHSLEDTLREFGNPLDKGKQRANGFDEASQERRVFGDESSQARVSSSLPQDLNIGDGEQLQSGTVRPKLGNRRLTSESEDDEPGPEFLLSHS